MKQYLLFLILSCSFMNAQTYHKLLGNTNAWHYIENQYGVVAPPPKGSFTQSVSSFTVWADPDLYADTDVGHNSYTWKEFNNGFGSVYGLIREDTMTQKVWFLENVGGANEILLYDFSLVTGDSIYLTFFNHVFNCGYQTGWYKVDSITNKNISGGMRRHFYLNKAGNPVNWSSGQVEPLVWIESVGCPVHVLYPFLDDCGGVGPLNQINYWYMSQLMCRSINTTRTYFDSLIYNGIQTGTVGCYATFDSCHYGMVCGNVDEYNGLKELKLFPQPAADVLALQFISDKNEKAKISICDITGRIIKPESNLVFSKGDNEIPIHVSGFESGFYFLILQRENSVVKLKFMVQK